MSREPHDPRDDTEAYSIGTILVKQHLIAREELNEVIDIQRRMSEDELLGELLVRRGLITPGQLDTAIAAQRGLRSRRHHERALAAATLAVDSGTRIQGQCAEVNEVIKDLRRKRISDQIPTVRLRPNQG